jgi:hypothetical protein
MRGGEKEPLIYPEYLPFMESRQILVAELGTK